MAEHLAEDLITEILCRLPIKILIGFKCVSKTWNILISDVCIPRISREPSPVTGFVFHAGSLSDSEECFIDFVSYSDECANDNATTATTTTDGFRESLLSQLPPEYFPYDLLDCCNGLILLVSRSVPRYYVCNPATKQCFALPIFVHHLRVCHAALAFNPRESSCYKVIRFIYALGYSASEPPAIDIYSSESTHWYRRKVPVEPPVAYGVGWVKYSVYLDGMLYKLSLSKHLLRFDFNAVSAQAIDVPCKDKIDTCGFIGVCKDVLNYANHDRSRILIWHFDKHNKAGCYWILKHSLWIKDLCAQHPAGWHLYERRSSPMFMPYAIHPSADIIFIGLHNIVFSYHLQSHRLEVLCRQPADRVLVWGHFSFYPYAPCFLALKERCSISSQLSTTLKETMKIGTRHDDAKDNEVTKAPEAA